MEIADDGPGIPEDQIELVSDPLLTTKLAGNGLGLPISRDVVNAHLGLLDLESRPDGTAFNLRLSTRGLDPGVRDTG